jgi:hypothetical protein
MTKMMQRAISTSRGNVTLSLAIIFISEYALAELVGGTALQAEGSGFDSRLVYWDILFT